MIHIPYIFPVPLVAHHRQPHEIDMRHSADSHIALHYEEKYFQNHKSCKIAQKMCIPLETSYLNRYIFSDFYLPNCPGLIYHLCMETRYLPIVFNLLYLVEPNFLLIRSLYDLGTVIGI